MYSYNKLPWMKIHNFLLDIGNIRTPKDFCVRVIQEINSLIPYDQARVYFVDDTFRVLDEFLVGVEPRWSDAYLNYYSKLEDGRYSFTSRGQEQRYSIPRLAGSVYDWASYGERDEFINGYIKPQGLSYSAGFVFHSADSTVKSVYALDRTARTGFSRKEIDILRIIQPQLDNLHRNLFVRSLANGHIMDPDVQGLLTKRETEIAALLCEGLTPAEISQELVVCVSTVYKHIANMHTKLNVSNRQELLLKLIQLSGTRRNLE